MPNNKVSIQKKLVVVGDGAVGKTCLLLVFAQGEFPQYYLPTVFEHHLTDIIIDSKRVTLELWDTAGQEEYSRLRPLSYPNADIILLCCSVDLPQSLENAQNVWLPEILQHCPRTVQVMLVVNKIDLRYDENTLANLDITDEIPLQKDQCERVGKQIMAAAVVECSVRQRIGVDEVFETAARLVLKNEPGGDKKPSFKKASRNSKCVIL